MKSEKNKPKIADNQVRSAQFLQIEDKQLGLISFIVDLGFEENFSKMIVRLRGIVGKRFLEGESKNTWDYVEEMLAGSDVVMLKFMPKGANKNSPYLVDVWLNDGTHLNEWLLEHRKAERYERNPDRG